MQTISNQGLKLFPQRDRFPLRLIALGDSLIYGFGDPVGGGWVERLRRRWMSPARPGHALYNLGVRGNGVAQVSQRLEQEFRQRGELRNRLPDLIILCVGVNDSPRIGNPNGRLFTDFEQYQAQVANLLDKAQQLCSVLFVGMVPVDESKMPFLNCFYYNHIDQYRYKEATKQACEVRQIPYLDIYDLWIRRGENWVRSHLCPDGLHPNARGYRVLLQDVLNWEPISQLAYG
jgi:lysophospholipase L1-like esterase